jgi:hypothetical protein
MATVLEESHTEEQRSDMRFCGQKDSMQEWFPFTVGSVCRVKQFTTEVDKRGKRFADDEEVETEVRKWMKQQSKYLHAAGFDARVKRWDKCANVSGGYVEKQISHVLRFI